MSLKKPISGALALAVLAICVTDLSAQGAGGAFRDAAWREVGPAAFSGRIVDLAVHPADESKIWVASASGGLWRTENRGTTWKALFQDKEVISIGDVAVAPSAPDRLYLGTGEANNQRSSYWGNGVWRSDDGGDTWSHMGLVESHHIGRIAVHPKDADTFFVAALGHLYSPNPERGLYRSRDGGLTFDAVLTIDENVGVVDVVIDPQDPNRVYAASYERRRRAWNFDPSGPGSAIWRSLDGGDTWERLGGGLPDGEIGRIGLALHAGDPGTLFACIENQNERGEQPRAEPEGEGEEEEELDRPDGMAPGVVRPVGGQVFVSEDGGDTWVQRNERPVGGSPGYYYGQIRVDPNDVDRLWIMSVRLYHSRDGGRTWRSDGANGVHVDHHALWISPTRDGYRLLGNDGGLAITFDDGGTWDVVENLPLGQFYAVTVDEARPYNIYGGTQDNGTWSMPSVGTRASGIADADVLKIYGGDGFKVAVDGDRPHVVYAESQFGGLGRIDMRTGARRSIKPRKEKGGADLRFNWMSPLVRSKHDGRTLYFGSQFLHRSYDRGATWEVISPDLSTRDADRIAGNVPHCTITAIAESPVRRDVLWAGTDDGKVWVTRDGGNSWDDLTARLPEEMQGLWISDIEASPHAHGQAWISVTGYREDRFDAHLLHTDDYGGTFSRRDGDLPRSPVNAVVEDPAVAGLLYVAQERGAQVSVDGGENWSRLGEGLPSVAVHDLALQAREGELVAATHGRGMWAIDLHGARAFAAADRSDDAWMAAPKVVRRPGAAWQIGYGISDRRFRGEHPDFGVHLHYWLKTNPEDRVNLEIQDPLGRRVRRLSAPQEAGLHKVVFDPRPQRTRGQGRAAFGRGRTTPPGTYVAVLSIGEKTWKQSFVLPVQEPVPAEMTTDEDEAPFRRGVDDL